MKKKIKGSKRGLTFSLDDAERIGTKFRYVIDAGTNEILIISDKEGSSTVSRKKAGNKFKALYDLRSADVRNLVSEADYMEVECEGEEIVVHVYRKASRIARFIRRNIVSINDILCVKSGEIRLSSAAGCEGQLSFEDMALWEGLLTSTGYKGTVHEKPLTDCFTFISAFSGAGLMDYAYVKAGYKGVWANDACILDGKFCPELAQTYEHNIGCKLTIKDIREVDATLLPDADIVIGGPCCQAYSNANRRNIDSDEGSAKRHLVDDYVRIVKEKNPKIFVIENVPQILSKDSGAILDTALSTLTGYEFSTAVVNDSDVGGYTERRRAIIIGSRIGAVKLPELKVLPVRTVRDALSKIDETWEQYAETQSSENTRLLMSYVPEGGNWQDIPEHVRKFGPSTQSNVYRRLAWDAPSPTITNWRKCCLTHPSEDRILNINEAAALMGLDKHFKFFGKSGAIQQMVGNGVTFAISSFVEKQVTKALKAFTGTSAGTVMASL